ncbi:hypothetical protein OGAPHI_001764 [Ogataea philodendri]|uniref:Uncharacterized protein n=1 Tax=Ogataea philodendri TaxID=1378263 RepID=A0A9P8PA51_9ASCO|nr:uncharacterized protein OGAPHI_001764 [Ogataea philodendri]KAH3668010.1 hypothetical protein OGAPHI_001764 [Ogataea philodendri]
MPSPVFISHPPPGFSVLSILRGIQLSVIGSYRAFINPDLFNARFYSRAISILKWSLIIHVIMNIPLIVITLFLRFLGLFLLSHETVASVLSKLRFFQVHLLNINPFLIMSFKFFTNDLDYIYFDSLKFADKVYAKNHPKDPKNYTQNLEQLEKYTKTVAPDSRPQTPGFVAQQINSFKSKASSFSWAPRMTNLSGFTDFTTAYVYNTAFSILFFVLAKTPYVGGLVFPIVTFRNLNRSIGTVYSLLIVFITLLLPQNYSLFLLNTIFGSKQLMMILLKPYFKCLPLNSRQREEWYLSRIGCLYGFSLVFYLVLRLPIVGLIAFGIAEAATGHLTTKITEPPPASTDKIVEWVQEQCLWNKEYYEEINDIMGDIEPTIPGTFKSE